MAKKKLKIGDSEPVEVEVESKGTAEDDERTTVVNCDLTYKRFDARAEVEEGERAVVATITTGAIDRDGEIVLASGGDFSDFQKNPVVLFGHRYYDPPIGKAMWIKSQGSKIIAKTVIAPGERGDEILALMQGGFLKAFSIGFSPSAGKSGPPTTAELKRRPEWSEARTIHREWKLLEYSVVTVPANPEALAMAVSKGEVSLSQNLANSLGVKLPAKRTVVPVRRKISIDKQPCKVIQHKRTVAVIAPPPKLASADSIADMVAATIKRHLPR